MCILIAAPNFVSSMSQGDFVYFFFRETAVEYINCGKVSSSRRLIAQFVRGGRADPFRERAGNRRRLNARQLVEQTGIPRAVGALLSTGTVIFRAIYRRPVTLA